MKLDQISSKFKYYSKSGGRIKNPVAPLDSWGSNDSILLLRSKIGLGSIGVKILHPRERHVVYCTHATVQRAKRIDPSNGGG